MALKLLECIQCGEKELNADDPADQWFCSDACEDEYYEEMNFYEEINDDLDDDEDDE